MPVVLAQGQPAAAESAYQPYGAAREVLYDRSDAVVLDGPAGTGKSRAVCEKLFILATKYPGSRHLMIRKTRTSLTQSTLVTWEQKVVPGGHPCLRGASRNNRSTYMFPNGSEVVLGGMDKPTRIMSTEYDTIYCPEMIEFTEDEVEALTTRLRNGKMPYQQLLGDTNPDGPRHWIKQREARGTIKLIQSRHEHNPAIWDMAKNRPTEAGAKYLAVLDKLTGVRYKRLRQGLWVAAEGLIYEHWDPYFHLVYRGTGDEVQDFAIRMAGSGVIVVRHGDGRQVKLGRECRRLWAIDLGYTNPFVWQEWIEAPDGDLYMVREIYKTQALVEDHAKAIKAATNGDPMPSAIICDHDAEDRATLERHLGLTTIGAYKGVSAGIQAFALRLGRPDTSPEGPLPVRLYILRDARIHPADERLIEAKKPTCTAEEMDAYAWDTKAGQAKGDQPVKENDHGADTGRYLVCYVDDVRSNGQSNEGQWYVV